MTTRRFFCAACQSECFELAGTCRGCGASCWDIAAVIANTARLRPPLDGSLAGGFAVLLLGFIVGVVFAAVTRERDIEDLARVRACELAR